MTWVGLDVHARSISAAAVDVLTGELTRARFGPGYEELIGWLGERRAPSRVVYEAGPTGFALYRQARVAGIEIEVIAPSRKTRPVAARLEVTIDPGGSSSFELATPHRMNRDRLALAGSWCE